jgi:hypothetical protein
MGQAKKQKKQKNRETGSDLLAKVLGSSFAGGAAILGRTIQRKIH